MKLSVTRRRAKKVRAGRTSKDHAGLLAQIENELERNPSVQVPFLHRQSYLPTRANVNADANVRHAKLFKSYEEGAEEKEEGVVEVVGGDHFSREDAQDGEERQWQESGDGQRQRLRDPISSWSTIM